MTYQYQINRLLFSDGEWQGISSLTILIGPNNAGKSRALRDIVGRGDDGVEGRDSCPRG